MQRLSEPILVKTDVANFRDLVQKLTGLPTADVVEDSDEAEWKLVYNQKQSKSYANKRRQSRLQEEVGVSCALITNPEWIDSSRRRRGSQCLTEVKDVKDLCEGECVEAPELLVLFPLSCSRPEV